jgi:endoglucanase
MQRVPKLSQLAVDIGAKDKDEAKRLAPVGTAVVFTTEFKEIGEACLGKAFDDRAGCAALVALVQGARYPFDLYGVFTVQEEVGLRGAGVAAYTVEPDVGVALEGTLADDLPKEEEDVSPTTTLGRGPAITVMDRSYTTPPRLLSHVVQSADAEGIAYQFKQPGIGGTDAGGIHRARSGVPAITVAVPCRYIHSPVSMLRRGDLESLVQLVDGALRKLTPDVVRY